MNLNYYELYLRGPDRMVADVISALRGACSAVAERISALRGGSTLGPDIGRDIRQ